MTDNPYHAPLNSGMPSGQMPHRGIERLKVPAILMIVFTVMGLINISLGVVLRIAEGSFSLDISEPQNLGYLIGMMILPLFHLVFLYGSYLMLTGKQFSSARIAMSLACIPVCSPCLILGIPVAIWALVVMHDPHVQADFES